MALGTPKTVRAELVEALSLLSGWKRKKDGPSTGSGRTELVVALTAILALSACARQTLTGAVAADAPGFLRGLWDGFIFIWSWLVSLFVPEVAVYAVPNNGGWYDFGYFLGIVVFGVGARKSHTVYRDRVVHVPLKDVTPKYSQE